MCWPSSHLPPLTFHPSAGVDKLLISLFTSLIHSFNTFQADSLVWKLTCQHFALPIQEHWVEKEGKCWLHRSRRRKNDSFLAILLHLVAFPGMHCSKNLGRPACSQNMFLCFVTAWDHMASTRVTLFHLGWFVLNIQGQNTNNCERQVFTIEHIQSKEQERSAVGFEAELSNFIHSL